MDQLEVINGLTCIEQTKWEKIYKSTMDVVRDWIKDNQQEILETFNQILFKEMWDKYAGKNISAYEMEALCFYYHDHELKDVKTNKYGIVDFNDLSPEPAIDYFFKRNGRDLPIYKISKINFARIIPFNYDEINPTSKVVCECVNDQGSIFGNLYINNCFILFLYELYKATYFSFFT